MKRAPELRATNLRLHYGDVVAVRDVSFVAPAGLVTAILGPSGCGKTTVLRAIAGFERPATGSIALGGRVLVDASRFVLPEQRRVGMVFQEGALFPHLVVAKNVAYGLPRRDCSARVEELLDRLGLAELRERYPGELSSGQRQRVAVARALAPRPDLVLLDEPFANLDAASRATVRDEVLETLRSYGTTTILVTHDQEEALSVADWVVVMDGGEVLQVGHPQDIYRQPASAWVARFVGDGQLLPVAARGTRLSSLLGEVGRPGDEGGLRRGDQVMLVVRPEEIELHREDSPHRLDGPAGVVTGCRFYGHDRIDVVALDEGTTLRVRGLGDIEAPAIGDRVRVALRPGGGWLVPIGDRGDRAQPPAAFETAQATKQ